MKESISTSRRGGGFLLGQSEPDQVFTPEDFSEEQQLIREMTRQFVESEVVPRIEEIETKDWEVTKSLLRGCADLGLLGIEVPEKYGGENLDKVSAMIVMEQLGRVGSFAVSYGGQAGIGTLPIVYFGTDDQKSKYLPRLAKGELFTSYALSESSSGSDALSARASAALSEDGKHWVLNGEKMWITNASFADVFITFAQVDGDKFSCFIVERGDPGVSTGSEEQKMGLLGSSTSTVILDNARIPVGNLLGEIGKGHHVAFNILNTGRAKLGANAVGGSKTALDDAIGYANQRIAFGGPISRFGAIQHKLAEMAIRTWVTETMVYRTAGMMDDSLHDIDVDEPAQVMRAIEEYAVECSMLKVFGTEVLDYVVDEAVQIHGGYGYSKEYAVERYYRDARVNRIFEGTNEINRMLIPVMLFKRAQSGRLPLIEAGEEAVRTVLSGSTEQRQIGESSVPEAPGIARLIALFVATTVAKKYGDRIREEQEVLMHLSNILMEAFAIDASVVRLSKLTESSLHTDVVQTFVADSLERIGSSARQALGTAVPDSRELTAQLAAIHQILGRTPVDTVATRRRIAGRLIEEGRYCL